MKEGCIFCSGDNCLYDRFEDLSGKINDTEGKMEIWDGDRCVGLFSIRFCPACGRKLSGGAEWKKITDYYNMKK